MKIAFCLGVVLLASGLHAADRPNILCLVSEDNGRFLGCYGDPLARTPTLDRLAKEGILYERCFTQPVCAPSRFALITGMSPVTCGPAQHMRASGKIPGWLKGFPTYLRESGYYTSNNSKTDYNSPISTTEAWNASGKQAHWRKRASGQPFFSVFNHEVTHESCLFPENEPSLFDASQMRIPPYQPDTPELRADWARYYTRLAKLDEQVAVKLKELADDGLTDDTIVFYYSDNGGVLPRSKRFLHESGTHVPLIIYFPPKWRHLAPAEPGARIKDPVHFLDFAPTMLSLAGISVPEHLQGRAFAGAGKAPPAEFVFCSRDRMDERYDMLRSVIDQRWLYIRNYRPDLPYVQPLSYMFQARGYQSWARVAREGKLTPATSMFWGEKPSEELYDTQSDPDNIRNLAREPAHQATLKRMQTALNERVIANRDNGFLPEGSPLEGYAASRVPGAFPIERVVVLANQASDRDVAHLPRFIEALGDPSEPVRWWAAQGCTMLGTRAAPAEAALRARLDDSSGAVQVAAAEALARLGQFEIALKVLEHWMDAADTPFTRLQAANVLDRLGPSSQPALPRIKSLLDSLPKEAGSNSPNAYSQRIMERMIAVLEGREPALVYATFPATIE